MARTGSAGRWGCPGHRMERAGNGKGPGMGTPLAGLRTLRTAALSTCHRAATKASTRTWPSLRGLQHPSGVTATGSDVQVSTLPLCSPGPSWWEHPCRASQEAGDAGRRPAVPSCWVQQPGPARGHSMASPGPSCRCLLPPALPWAELALDPTSPGPLPSSFRGVRPSSQGASSPPPCH